MNTEFDLEYVLDIFAALSEPDQEEIIALITSFPSVQEYLFAQTVSF